MKKYILFRIRSMQMGGVPKVLIDIIENLDKEKFVPLVMMDLRQGELVKNLPQSARVIFLTQGREEMGTCQPLLFFRLAFRYLKLKGYRFFPGLLKKKVGVTPDIEVSITHSSLPALVRSPFKNSRKISWFHTDLEHHHSFSQGKRIAEMMKRCHTNVFVCRSILLNMEKHLNMKIRNTVCIYNMFNKKQILSKAAENIRDEYEKTIMKKEHLFVSVGRLCFQKGYDQLITTHAELIREGFVHHIAVVGNGPDYDDLKKAVLKYGVEDSFFLLGSKENPYPYIHAADYYIQPSRYEAYPLAVGEALVLNKPLISTDAGGVSEFITHRGNGYLTSFTKESLKEGIISFLTKPELVEQIIRGQQDFDCESYNRKIQRRIDLLFIGTLQDNKE